MTNLASTFPPTQRIEVLRLDNVCYIKHPRPALQVKARDSMPPLFTSPLCTLWEESIGRVWCGKGFPPFLSPVAESLLPAA